MGKKDSTPLEASESRNDSILSEASEAAVFQAVYSAEEEFVDDLLKDLEAMDLVGSGYVTISEFLETLTSRGFGPENPLMKITHRTLLATKKDKMTPRELHRLLHSNAVLVSKVLKNDLVVPEFREFRQVCEEIFEEQRSNVSGKNADYIPQLAEVDPDLYSMSVTTIDGQVFHLGDSSHLYCVQSVSKPVTYGIALTQHGEEKVHNHVGREPSGRSFNEMSLKNVPEEKRDTPSRTAVPHNPMINAGAIVCSSLISPGEELAHRLQLYLNYWQRMCAAPVGFDVTVFLSERESADRNHALAYMMKEMGSFENNVDIERTLEFYFQTCSVQLNTKMLSCAAATFANGGTNPLSGDVVFSGDVTRDVTCLMLSCGMYDFSGEWAFSIGLPAKSGVSGAVHIVVPGVMGIAIYNPRLNGEGNCCRAIEIARELCRRYALHMFDHAGSEKLSVTGTKAEVTQNQVTDLLYAAYEGDVSSMARFYASGVSLDACDYDSRTALHLACAQGHLKLVKFLLSHGASINLRDRWGSTPLQDAIRNGREDLISLLKSLDASE